MQSQQFNIFIAVNPNSTKLKPPERQPGYVFAWLHADARKARTLAIHPDPQMREGYWSITHVHSGYTLTPEPFNLAGTITPQRLVAEACHRLDGLANTSGLRLLDSVMDAAEKKPHVPFPVAL